MYYIYLLARPNGKPFYVGKGTGKRVFDHDREARRGHKCHKCNIIRKIWRNGGEIQRYVVFTTDNEEEAFEYECTMIALMDRSTLANRTDGGEGGSGRVDTPKNIAERSKRMKQLWSDPEYRARKIAELQAANKTPEILASISVKAKQRWSDPAFRQRATAAITKAIHDPEFRARHKASLNRPEYIECSRQRTADRWKDDAYRAEQMARLQSQWDDPVYRKKTLAARDTPEYHEQQKANGRRLAADPDAQAKRLATLQTPETRARMRDAGKKIAADPEWRARMSAQVKAKWADPEWRAMMVEKRRAQWSNASPESRANMRAALDAGRRARGKKAAGTLTQTSLFPLDLSDTSD